MTTFSHDTNTWDNDVNFRLCFKNETNAHMSVRVGLLGSRYTYSIDGGYYSTSKTVSKGEVLYVQGPCRFYGGGANLAGSRKGSCTLMSIDGASIALAYNHRYGAFRTDESHLNLVEDYNRVFRQTTDRHYIQVLTERNIHVVLDGGGHDRNTRNIYISLRNN